MIEYDIHLLPMRDRYTDTEFKFPILPEEIKAKSKANYQTYKVISNGQCQIPKGTDCDEFSWEGVFPGFGTGSMLSWRSRPHTMGNPENKVEKILKWMNKGTILTLVIAGTNINQEVTISDFSYTHKGAYGDIEYDITLTAYKNLQIFTTKDLGIKTPNTKLTTKKGNRGSKSSLIGKKYKIKKGDSLYGIALKVYGDGAKWTKLWNKNKKLLDKTALKKSNGKHKNSDMGRILYAGTKIKIP